MKKVRNSSVELLKLISMFLIVISHATPDGDVAKHIGAIDIGVSGQSLQVLICTLFHNLGQIGNVIFIACSSYFLLDSKKSVGKKALFIIGDTFAISVLMFIPFWIFSDYKFSALYTVKQFFPVTFGNNWFIPCYLLFYAIHPLLNMVLDKIEKKTHLLFNVMFVLLYCVLNFMLSGLFFYSRFIGFIGIYFLMSYIKKYLPETSSAAKVNTYMLIFATLAWILTVVFINISGQNIMGKVNSLINPFFIIMGLSAFNIARNHTFFNKTINYLSSLTLYIYLIHCNRIIRDLVRFTFYDHIIKTYSYENLVLWVLLYSVISFIGAIILSIVYNTFIKKWVNKLFEKIGVLISIIYEKIENKVLSLR